MAQEPNWSSSNMASGITPENAWTRGMRLAYGTGRNDDIIAYSQQNRGVMNPSSGFQSRSGSNGNGSNWLGSGSVKMKFGRGNTSSDPGGYNYDTLNNTIRGAASAVKWGFNTRNKLRANQEKQDRTQTLKDARSQKEQDAQKNQNLTTFANKTLKQSRDLQAGNFATRTRFSRGASSSAPAQNINLLTGPGAFPDSFFKKRNFPQTPKD